MLTKIWKNQGYFFCHYIIYCLIIVINIFDSNIHVILFLHKNISYLEYVLLHVFFYLIYIQVTTVHMKEIGLIFRSSMVSKINFPQHKIYLLNVITYLHI